MRAGVDEALSDQVEVFVLEYCNHFNGTRAAKAAGYSEESAHDTASRLLRKTEVSERIEKELKRRAKELRIDGADVVLGIWQSIMRAAAKGQEGVVIKGYELLGKYLGIFEKDNRQKAGTEEDLETIKAKLREKGIDLDLVRARSAN